MGDYITINLRSYGLDSAVSIQGLLTTSCGHKYEAWSSVEGGEFLSGCVTVSFQKKTTVFHVVSWLETWICIIG